MLRSRKRQPVADGAEVDAVVEAVRERLPADVLASLIQTGEVRGGDPAAITALLRRFAVAEKLDAHKAARRLASHAAWRREHLPAGAISEDSVLGQIAQGKVLLQGPGPSGSPLLVIRVAAHLPIKDALEVERFVVFALEATARLCDGADNPDGKAWALFDLENTRWANMDATALRCCFSTLQAAFPERMRCIFMLNSPLIFDSLWRVVSPFVDPTTREKVQFLSGASGTSALLERLGPALLPKAYGGEAEEVPAHLVARRLACLREAAAAVKAGGEGGALPVADVALPLADNSSEDGFFDAHEEVPEERGSPV